MEFIFYRWTSTGCTSGNYPKGKWRHQQCQTIWTSRPGKNTRVPVRWYRDPGMTSLSLLPESQCKQWSVAGFDMFSRCFPRFLHQIMTNEQNHNKQISEKNWFLVCVNMVLVHLSFRYERVLTNFVSILFLLQKSSISAQASVMRVPGYLPRNYIPDPDT